MLHEALTQRAHLEVTPGDVNTRESFQQSEGHNRKRLLLIGAVRGIRRHGYSRAWGF